MKYKFFYPNIKKIMRPVKIEAMPVEIYLPEAMELNMESLNILFGQ